MYMHAIPSVHYNVSCGYDYRILCTELTFPSSCVVVDFLFLQRSMSSTDRVALAVAHSCGNACGSPLPSYTCWLVDGLSIGAGDSPSLRASIFS